MSFEIRKKQHELALYFRRLRYCSGCPSWAIREPSQRCAFRTAYLARWHRDQRLRFARDSLEVHIHNEGQSPVVPAGELGHRRGLCGDQTSDFRSDFGQPEDAAELCALVPAGVGSLPAPKRLAIGQPYDSAPAIWILHEGSSALRQ